MSVRKRRPAWLAALALTLFTPAFARPAAPRAIRTDRHGDPLPPGARARLGTVRLRPSGGYGAFALSPDGKTIATAEEGSVRLWDLATGRPLRSFDLGGYPVALHVRFSPDGKLVAAIADDLGASFVSRPPCSEHSIFMGEVATGKVLHRFKGDHHGFAALDFLRGGRALASWFRQRIIPDPGGERHDGTLVVWDLRTGKELRRSRGCLAHAVSPDGTLLAVGKRDGTVRLCRAATGKELRKLTGHRGPVTCVSFSPDGKVLASGGGGPPPDADELDILSPPFRGRYRFPGASGTDASEEKSAKAADYTVRLWDVATGKERGCWKGHRAAVTRLDLAPGARALLSADQSNTFLLWDTARGRVGGPFRKGERRSFSAAFSPDGGTLACAPGDGTVRLWDLAAGHERRRWEAPSRETGDLAFSPDGRLLLGLSAGLRIWDVRTGKERDTREGHRAAVRGLVFSPDGGTLASQDGDAALRLWDVRTGRPLPPLLGTMPHRVHRFGFTSDGKGVAALGFDLALRLWQLPAGRAVREFRVGTAALVPVWEDVAGWAPGSLDLAERPSSCAVLSPGCEWLAAVEEDGRVGVWDVAAGRKLLRLPAGQKSWGRLGFSPDGKALLTQGAGPAARLWSLPSGELLHRLKGDERASAFAAFAPDGTTLAWGWPPDVRLWDLARGRPAGRLRIPAEVGVGHLAFERGGKALVTGDRETVRLWDRGGALLRTLRRPGKPYCETELTTAPDGRVLASLSLDGKHSEWALREAATGRHVCTYSGWRQPWVVSPDGRTLALAGETIELREMATGGVVGRLRPDSRHRVTTLAFSPDGKTLATGGADSTVLLWDWGAACGLSAGRRALGAKELARLWDDLASPDAGAAYRAVGALAADPGRAVPWLARRVKAFAEDDCRRVRRLLADLDSEVLAVRKKAAGELAGLHAEWLPLFYEVLSGRPPLEVHRQVEALLDDPRKTVWSAPMRRRLRAVQALEQIGTPGARRVLTRLARGMPEARLTQEAGAALCRLAGHGESR